MDCLEAVVIRPNLINMTALLGSDYSVGIRFRAKCLLVWVVLYVPLLLSLDITLADEKA